MEVQLQAPKFSCFEWHSWDFKEKSTGSVIVSLQIFDDDSIFFFFMYFTFSFNFLFEFLCNFIIIIIIILIPIFSVWILQISLEMITWYALGHWNWIFVSKFYRFWSGYIIRNKGLYVYIWGIEFVLVRKILNIINSQVML